MNLGYVFAQGDPVLISVFMLLAAMSIASWYIIFWKGFKIHKERKALEDFRSRYIHSPDWPKYASIKYMTGCTAVLIEEANKLKPVLASRNSAERKEVASMHLAQSLDTVRSWFDKGLTLLASVGSSAPFIGLFGTVWGIYGALTRIATEGNASLNVVAGPMGEALIATAVGLFAAIPAVLAYNAFVRMNRLMIQDYRHICEALTTYFFQAAGQESAEPIKLVKGSR